MNLSTLWNSIRRAADPVLPVDTPALGVAKGIVGGTMVLVTQLPWLPVSFCMRLLLLVIGMSLLLTYWLHTVFFLGTWLTKQASFWSDGLRTFHSCVLPIRMEDRIDHNQHHDEPVLYVMNRLPCKEFQNAVLQGGFSNQGGICSLPFARLVVYDSVATSTRDEKFFEKARDAAIVIPRTNAFQQFSDALAIAMLQEKDSVVLFPEGKHAEVVEDHQSRNNKSWDILLPFQSGAFQFAFKHQIPIVPILHDGTTFEGGRIQTPETYFKMLPTIRSDTCTSWAQLKEFVHKQMQAELQRMKKRRRAI